MRRARFSLGTLLILVLVAGQSLAQEPRRVRGIWQGVITARSLNVREGPGENYEIVDKLKRGAKVEAVDAIGAWVRLNVESEAWVSKRFVKLPEDFMAPAFSDEENAFLDWAAARGDLEEISVDGDGRISLVLHPEQGDDPAVAATIAREVGCGYREQLEYEPAVTVTVWPEAGPAEGWVAQASCP